MKKDTFRLLLVNLLTATLVFSFTYMSDLLAAGTGTNSNPHINNEWAFSENSDFLVTGDEIGEAFNVWIKPNPNKGQFNIMTSGGKKDIHEAFIYNVIGEVIFREKFEGRVLETDITEFDKGLYILQVHSIERKKWVTKRFYIE